MSGWYATPTESGGKEEEEEEERVKTQWSGLMPLKSQLSGILPALFTEDRKRPPLKRWSNRVDLSSVMQTLRDHNGEIDIERDAVVRRPSTRSCPSKRLADGGTQTHFPLGSTRAIEEVPLGAIYATIVLSWNAVIMLVAEIIIEVLVVAEIYPKIPFRLSFLFLTILSGLLGGQTLVAVNRKEFDTSHNALQISMLVEVALIIGDVEFVLNNFRKYPASLPTRVPFAILTLVNVFLVSYLYIRLRLYESRTSLVIPELVRPVELGLGTHVDFIRTAVPPTRSRVRAWTLQGLGDAVVQHLAEHQSFDNNNNNNQEPLALVVDENAEDGSSSGPPSTVPPTREIHTDAGRPEARPFLFMVESGESVESQQPCLASADSDEIGVVAPEKAAAAAAAANPGV